MTAKEYLGQIYRISRKIEGMRRRIEVLESRIAGSSVLRENSTGPLNKRQDPTGDAASTIADLRLRLTHELGRV